jgi:hypothetical protein
VVVGAERAEHRVDLCGRLAAGSRPGHRDRDRDAGRRDDDVAAVRGDEAVEVEAERVEGVSRRGRILGGARDTGPLRHGQVDAGDREGGVARRTGRTAR